MRSIGYSPSKEQVMGMIRKLDLDGKGYVTFAEFAEVMRTKEVQVNDI